MYGTTAEDSAGRQSPRGAWRLVSPERGRGATRRRIPRFAQTALYVTVFAICATLLCLTNTAWAQATPVFSDDFEAGIVGWTEAPTADWILEPGESDYCVRVRDVGSVERAVSQAASTPTCRSRRTSTHRASAPPQKRWAYMEQPLQTDARGTGTLRSVERCTLTTNVVSRQRQTCRKTGTQSRGSTASSLATTAWLPKEHEVLSLAAVSEEEGSTAYWRTWSVAAPTDATHLRKPRALWDVSLASERA
jgi:hypothetical protein